MGFNKVAFIINDLSHTLAKSPKTVIDMLTLDLKKVVMISPKSMPNIM